MLSKYCQCNEILIVPMALKFFGVSFSQVYNLACHIKCSSGTIMGHICRLGAFYLFRPKKGAQRQYAP